ncbi:MAG: hypothetical protein IT363_03730 [Methanoregulaceae archaeon]|jgi:hypothetical protein|nr:hypothetical protein [Methanoregulaceae archaeon]
MNPETYSLIKLTLGVIATFGLYSVLYRENKFYRFWEHVFLGLAGGWALVALWKETLKPSWYDKMAGSIPETGGEGTPGYFVWAILLPIGMMGYMVFNKKHAWMSRIPIGIILGIWSGQQLLNFWRTYSPQFRSSMPTIVPTRWEFMQPAATPENFTDLARHTYISEAIGNLVAVITVLAVLSYFIFSIELKSKFMQGVTKSGRYLLMIGFGAIFGSTVMMRFTLLIDRMYFIWVEWMSQRLLGN